MPREYQCFGCKTVFNSLVQLRNHKSHCEVAMIPNIPELLDGFNSNSSVILMEQSALNNSYREFVIRSMAQCLTVDQFLDQTVDAIQYILNHCVRYAVPVKAYTTLECEFEKISIVTGEANTNIRSFFSTKSVPIQSESCIDDFITTQRDKFNQEVERFLHNGSNWLLITCHTITVRIVRYIPLRGGASNFPLPSELLKKQCVLNIKSEGNDCFKFAIAASIFHDQVDSHNKSRRAQYQPFVDQLDFSMVSFPATVEDIIDFQKANKLIAVNALMYISEPKEGHPKVVVLYHPPQSIHKGRHLAQILLINNHWLPITNFDRLMGEHDKHSAFCSRCLQNLYHPDRLERHMLKCFQSSGQQEIMPLSDKAFHSFQDWSKMLSPPFTMYADIECLLSKPSATDKYLQKHVPISVGSYLTSTIRQNVIPTNSVKIDQGVNCIESFCHYLDTLVHDIYKFNMQNCYKPKNKNSFYQSQFDNAKSCTYCKASFSDSNPKVWHHNHVSGDFIATICQPCNTKIRQPLRTLPVIFHNLKNYDMHSLCIMGFSKMPEWELDPIATTAEKYVTLTARVVVGKKENGENILFCVRFIDSYQFLTASLDNLAKSISNEQKLHTLALLKSHHSLQKETIFTKGIFPYSFLDHESMLDYIGLPPIEEFFDTLTNSINITEADYARAHLAYIQFGCQNFGDYMRAYLKLDVLLLADIFETFRRNSLIEYDLDPVNFVTLPQYSFAAAFNNQSVDLITDVNQYRFFEEAIRGGMTFINTHLVTANNLYINSNSNSDTYLAYWDANNLYGNSLRQKLPVSDFQWVDQAELPFIDWKNLDCDSDICYFVKVDLDYPLEIQDLTCDYPFAPERGIIEPYMLTPYMKQQWANRSELRGQSSTFHTEKKLLLSVTNKKEYVVHAKLLKFYLEKGLILTKVHEAIRFKQRELFRSYIDKNSAKRAAAQSAFEKDLYKLLNNALFGKTMENVRGRKKFKLVNSDVKMVAQCSKPQYLRSRMFSADLTLVEHANFLVELNKPIFVGAAVLDLSKLIMYDLRYNKLAKYESQFQCKIDVIGGDTDSIFCKISGVDLYKTLHPAMLQDGLLDTSNYPADHPLYSDKYKAKLGCIKDECAGQVIEEACLLKPKCYSLKTSDGSKKTAKGVQRCVREKFTHEDYVLVWRMQSEVARSVRRFQSKNHEIFTIEQQKWALSATDTKRAWVDDNNSLPYGHHSLEAVEPPVKKARLELPKIIVTTKPVTLSTLSPPNQAIPSTSKSFPCLECAKVFNNQHNLDSHKCKIKKHQIFTCPICKLEFNNQINLSTHKCKNKKIEIFTCTICKLEFNNEYNYKTHMGCKHHIYS